MSTHVVFENRAGYLPSVLHIIRFKLDSDITIDIFIQLQFGKLYKRFN